MRSGQNSYPSVPFIRAPNSILNVGQVLLIHGTGDQVGLGLAARRDR